MSKAEGLHLNYGIALGICLKGGGRSELLRLVCFPEKPVEHH